MSSKNINIIHDGGVQVGNFVNSQVSHSTFIIGQSDTFIDIKNVLAQYKNWILGEDNSQISKIQEQLRVSNQYCQKRTLQTKNNQIFSSVDLLNKISNSKTSLVTGPAWSGKSTLAALTTVIWAKSTNSKFDLVLFLSPLHKIDEIPLHKQLWGEYAGYIREQDSSKIYEKLLEMKAKLLFIIDGIGKKVE